MNMNQWQSTSLAVMCCACTSIALGDVLNIDFGSTRADDPVGVTYVGLAAAPDPAAGTAIWNDVRAAGLSTGFVDSQGNAVGASVNVPQGVAGRFIQAQEQSGGFEALFDNYVATRSGNAATQQIFDSYVDGLVPGGSYDLYFYGQGDNIQQNTGFRIGNDVRHTSYDFVYDEVSGIPGDGQIVEDIEYVKFTGIQANASGTIDFQYFNLTANGIYPDSSTGLLDASDPDGDGLITNPLDPLGPEISAYTQYGGFNAMQIVGTLPAPAVPLNLEINTTTGEITLQNTNQIAVNIDDYSITTNQSTLNPENWSTLDDQGLNQPGNFNGDSVVDAADYTVWRDNEGGNESTIGGNGDGDGTVDDDDYDIWAANYGGTSTGWEAAGFASSGYLGEFFLGASEGDTATIAPGASLSLGNAYTSGASDNSLVFEYFGAGGASVEGTVSFVSGAAAAVPEPTAALLVLTLASAGLVRRQSAV